MELLARSSTSLCRTPPPTGKSLLSYVFSGSALSASVLLNVTDRLETEAAMEALRVLVGS